MKVTVDKDLIEQAIDVINSECGYGGSNSYEPRAIVEALRAILAEPAVEPQRTGKEYVDGLIDSLLLPMGAMTASDVATLHHRCAQMLLLYAASPPPPAEVPMLSDEEVGMLTVYGGLHHVDVPLLAEFVRHIETTIRRRAGL